MEYKDYLMKIYLHLFIFFVLCTVFFFPVSLYSQKTQADILYYDQQSYPLYPAVCEQMPDIPSPFTTEQGMEVIIALTKEDKYALIPVTVENGEPLHYSRRIKSRFGKDQQLQVNSGDFPALAATGLHAKSELDRKTMITGLPVSVITYIGRPGRFSSAGFLAEDEDLISVLKSDNQLVKKMGLTHPQMAKPLFHVWNIILKEIEIGEWKRFWDNIPYFIYNGKSIFLKARGTKGWQTSIFQDEIQ